METYLRLISTEAESFNEINDRFWSEWYEIIRTLFSVKNFEKDNFLNNTVVRTRDFW